MLALLNLFFSRRIWALVGGGFALSTLAGYLLSVWVGMFGFHETRTSAGVVAAILEITTFVVLFAYAGFVAPAPARDPLGLGPVARRSLVPLGVVAALALVLTSVTSPALPSGPRGSPSASSTTGASVKISIMSFTFAPARVVVVPGETIIVTNHDSVTHTFSAKPQSNPQGTFASGDIAPGRTVTIIAPASPGAYAYYCSIHNSMTGILVVR